MKVLALFVAWAALSVVNFGLFYADIQSTGDPRFACGHARKDAGVSVLMSILPVMGSVLAVLATGFAENGIRYHSRCGEVQQ